MVRWLQQILKIHCVFIFDIITSFHNQSISCAISENRLRLAINHSFFGQQNRPRDYSYFRYLLKWIKIFSFWGKANIHMFMTSSIRLCKPYVKLDLWTLVNKSNHLFSNQEEQPLKTVKTLRPDPDT